MKKWQILELGSGKSGNWGHAGRPGLRGGSVPRSVAMSIRTGKDWKERQAAKGKFGSSGVDSVIPLGWGEKGVNDSVIMEFADGSKGIFKSEDMEHGSMEGEILAYELSEALGWGIVPETVEFTYGGVRGSLQKWEDGEVAIGYKGGEAQVEPYKGLTNITNPGMARGWERTQALDQFLDNRDRHMGNLLIGKDKVWAIDNGGAFHAGMGGKSDMLASEYAPSQGKGSAASKELNDFFLSSPNASVFQDRVNDLLGYEYVYAIGDYVGNLQ